MRTRRLLLNSGMTLLLLLLMPYSLIGERFHELAGTAMLVLVILHNVQNRGFWKNLFRGRYSPERGFRTALNVLLLCMMLLQPLCGIAMSKHLYTFLPVTDFAGTARLIHLMLAYWCYALMGLHVGMHMDAMTNKIKKKTTREAHIVLTSLAAAIACYGLFAFFKRQFPMYMFGLTEYAFFDYSEPLLFFYLDYLAILFFFLVLGTLIIKGLRRLSGKRAARRYNEQK